MTDVVFLIGQSGAGKSTLAARIACDARIRVINVGDVIVDLLKDNDCALQSRRDAGAFFVENFRVTTLTKRIVAMSTGYERVVIDGVRLPSLWNSLSRISSQSISIGITCSPEIRLKRLMQRDRIIVLSEEDYGSEISYLMRRVDVSCESEFGKQSIADFRTRCEAH